MLVNNKTLKKLILVLVAVSMIIGLTHFASLIARAENDDHLETEIVNTDESQDIDYSYLYEDGKIKIYNLKQLQAIGSHQPVKLTDNNEESFSKGDVLLVENTVITYSLDAQYLLMNDIVLDNENIWSLPDNFTGSFTSLETQNNKTLYDQQIDTIYIYNNYQLKILLSDNASKEPVMTQDYHASEFGMGQMIYPQDSQDYLTYNHSHHYVLSQFFTSDMPELISQQMKATQAETKETSDGRQFAGQVIWTDRTNQKEYILIGNKEQLAAIGSNEIVHTAVYQAKLVIGKWEIDKDADGHAIMLYGGDADLLASQNGKKDYDFGEIEKATLTKGRCGVNQKTGEPDPNMDIKDTGHTYSRSENYIIFRDIDLNNDTWTPLMFSGTMEGRLDMDENQKVTISNINIYQENEIDLEKQSGVGFFGSIMSESKNTIGVSDNSVLVKNIQLDKISVTNNAALIKDKTGLIQNLLKILVIIIGSLSEKLEIVLNNLLNPNQSSDPTVFATGTFAGRVSGDVVIDNCSVKDINNVSSAKKDMIGGFVGNVEGVTKYGNLQNTLGNTVKLLTEILNIIPFIDLGTLVQVLLDGGIIKAGELIPTGYYSPVISNCSINSNSLLIGNENESYIGSFAGRQVGAVTKNCSVNVKELKINGKDMIGGFSGFSANAELHGLLDNLGIDLVKSIRLNSFTLNCTICTEKLSITASNSYAGGLTGALANSFLVDSSILGEVDISAKQYAGGLTGIATLGQSISLGDYETAQSNLVSLIGSILSGTLSGENQNALLSLTGISPSVIAGNSIENNLTIKTVEKYAGGIIGKGDGVIITSSDNLADKSFIWKNIDLSYTTKNKLNTIASLSSINAEKYAGGIAGYVATASAGGILDTTLGIGNYLPFKIDNVNISGVSAGYTIEASHEYAGGAIGMAIGGKMNNVTLTNIQYVNALNHVGGFIGSGGTGSLVSAGGLNLLGLDLVKVDNLLNLAQAVVLDIDSAQVIGISSGMSIKATGSNQNGEVTLYDAAGFIGESTSANINGASVKNVKEIKADIDNGIAGGFVGSSNTGGLASISEDKTSVPGIVDISNLISAAGYLIPKYTNCMVEYISNENNPQVMASIAGGFIGNMQSGTIENSDENYLAVKNIEYVQGTYYAGGFAGKAYSGGIVNSGGLSLLGALKLNVSAANIVSVLEVYIPIIKNANIDSTKGLIVMSNNQLTTDSHSGSAGGYIGYGSGVQVSHCEVNGLRNTKVTPPEQLENIDAPSYFNDQSSYAIKAPKYAGGFIGYMDVGSAASVGNGLSILGESIQLADAVSVLSAVVTTIEFSHVKGKTGGFSVLASSTENSESVGHAGGYAGMIKGGHIQNSNVENFNYIIAQETAGGYVGDLEPGSLASVLDGADTSLLTKILDVNGLLSIGQTFIPTIRNSTTSCIPCGGAIRANAPSSLSIEKGMAGGYVGRNSGGQIWGNNNSSWKNQLSYNGPQSPCSVIRLRSVYGYEYAGGFTGLMECASTAQLGDVSILNGLIKLDNVLGLLNDMYPTEENTSICGPLKNINQETWNAWVENVGHDKSYGAWIKTVNNDKDLQNMIDQFSYGYKVVAGRDKFTDGLSVQSGCAGGYNGMMKGGIVTNATANDVMYVSSLRSAGGFSGEMITGGTAKVGNVSLLGLQLVNVGNLLNPIEVFVPVVKSSSTHGFRSGMTVVSFGNDITKHQGNAGGYVGNVVGGQIWGEDTKCQVTHLKLVRGANHCGGFAGKLDPGSIADVETGNQNGLIGGLLDNLISNVGSLADVLQATVTTVKNASVDGVSSGFSVVGGNSLQNALYAGGFVGKATGTVLGKKDEEVRGLSVNHLRMVNGGEYAGGFVGLADVGSAASISDDSNTSILHLINTGNISVLDAFRPYMYYCQVSGISDGFVVTANLQNSFGQQSSLVYSGCAGGFAGAVLNGTVENSTVQQLNTIQALNYAGGFAGHLGKSGTVDLDSTGVNGGILELTAGVIDVCGTIVKESSVTGITDGFVIKSEGGKQPISGGFAGLADLGRISTSKVNNAKKIYSDEIAGGFAGKTTMAYLVDTEANSVIVNALLKVVNGLLKFLYADKLQDLELVDVGLGGALKVQLLADGKTLSVTLLGLEISVALSRKGASDNPSETDVAIVTIGDSTVRLPCTENGLSEDANTNLQIELIKANRTKITDSSITGVSIGYDVFGGKATDKTDGTGDNGIAGGFIGYNNEGYLINNQMYLADTIRGTENKIGEFIGQFSLESHYQEEKHVVGQDNEYRIYRAIQSVFKEIKKGNQIIGTLIDSETTDKINVYKVNHYQSVKDHQDYDGAVLSDENQSEPLNVYISPAKAVLMDDIKTSDNEITTTPNTPDSADPCSEKIFLTVQKVWKDFSNLFGSRPDNIHIKITRHYKKDTSNIQDEKFNSDPQNTIELSKLNQEQNVWETVVSNLDAYYVEKDNDGNIIASYPYIYEIEEVKEDKLNNYTTTYEWDEYHYSAVVTNKNYSILPNTGGMGIWIYVFAGMSIIAVTKLSGRKRKKKTGVTSK